jgi:hypothetical protein
MLQPVLLELLPHMQDQLNVWRTPDPPTTSSSSGSEAALAETDAAAAAFTKQQASVSKLRTNLSQVLVSLACEGDDAGKDDTCYWHYAGAAHRVRLQCRERHVHMPSAAAASPTQSNAAQHAVPGLTSDHAAGFIATCSCLPDRHPAPLPDGLAWFTHQHLQLMGCIDACLLLPLLADEDNKQAMCSLMCSKPGLLLPAYEAALRCLATSPDNAMATTAALAARAVAGASAAAAGRVTQVFGSDTALQQLQRQLFALQVTCIKCALAAATKQLVTKTAAAEAFGSIVATSNKVLMHIVTQCAGSFHSSAGSSSSSCSSSSSSSSSSESSTAAATVAAPWVGLLAHCLHALAGMVEAAGTLSVAPTLMQSVHTVPRWQQPPPVLQAVQSCMAALTNHLGRARLQPDQLQQLQEEHATATRQLDEVKQARQGTWAAVSMQQQLPALAQQLCRLAQAIAGHIAISNACNNPSCSNLAQRSELVLVGGKCCVCANCKAAR